MTLISTTGRLEIDRPPLDRQFGDHARPARKGMCEAFANGHALEDIERAALEAALEKSGGNRKRAARVLGVSLRTIYNMIDRFGLPKRQAGSSESRASRG